MPRRNSGDSRRSRRCCFLLHSRITRGSGYGGCSSSYSSSWWRIRIRRRRRRRGRRRRWQEEAYRVPLCKCDRGATSNFDRSGGAPTQTIETSSWLGLTFCFHLCVCIVWKRVTCATYFQKWSLRWCPHPNVLRRRSRFYFDVDRAPLCVPNSYGNVTQVPGGE